MRKERAVPASGATGGRGSGSLRQAGAFKGYKEIDIVRDTNGKWGGNPWKQRKGPEHLISSK